jgi:hypothetical protein
MKVRSVNMSKYIETEISGNSVFVEVNEKEEATNAIDRGKPSKQVTFENIIADVKKTAKSIFDSLQEIGIKEVELDYGIKLGVKAGVSIWVISEVSSEANFTIKLKWTNPNV